MKQFKDRDDTIDALTQDNLNYQQQLSAIKGELENVTKDRNRLMREYNELAARKKVATISLGSVKKRLGKRQG